MKYMREAAGYTWTDDKTCTQRLQINIKYNHSFGQNTGLQKKLDMTCKQQVSSQITHNYKNKLRTKRQKEPEKTVEEASGCL